jgi:hypothetical protein
MKPTIGEALSRIVAIEKNPLILHSALKHRKTLDIFGAQSAQNAFTQREEG